MPTMDFGSAFEAVKHTIQEELVMESTLHVTALQAGQCHQRFDGLSTALPAPATKWDEIQLHSMTTLAATKTAEAAVCLATPFEPAEEELHLQQLPVRATVGRIAA
jgi:hypothetical protein